MLLQHLADQARLEVVRPQSVETTALGAATMAGLAEGVWGSLGDLTDLWTAEASFTPEIDGAVADAAHADLDPGGRAVAGLGVGRRHLTGATGRRRESGQSSSRQPWSASSAMMAIH